MSNSTSTGRPLRWLVVLVVALTCTGVVATASWAERSDRSEQVGRSGSEYSRGDRDDDDASCHNVVQKGDSRLPRRGRTTWGHPPAGGASGGQTLRSVAIGLPATTFLRLNKAGRITAAATNTRCPPRRLDTIYVYRSDGSITSSTDIDLGRIHWQGDFSRPGVFQGQSPALPICSARRTQCE